MPAASSERRSRATGSSTWVLHGEDEEKVDFAVTFLRRPLYLANDEAGPVKA